MRTEISKLKNGLRIISTKIPNLKTVSVGLWIDCGTRDEDKKINGISHVLEHMAFKGTKKRSAFDIAAEIESVGGYLNAYTSRENTFYFAKVMQEDLGLAVNLMSDIILNSTMDEKELAREKAVILQEIAQTNDTPDDIIFDYLQENAFPDQPMGQPILGTEDIVNQVTSEILTRYMNNTYAPARIILSAAGNVDHSKFQKEAKNCFGNMQKGSNFERTEPRYMGLNFELEKSLEQVHFAIGFKGVSYHDNEFYPALALSTLLGGGMASRLFQEIREKRGLAYSIYSFVSAYSDTGLFGIYAACSQEHANELIPLITTEIKKITSTITSTELKRIQSQLRANTLMSLESPSSLCEQMARQLSLFNRYITPNELLEQIFKIDTSSIKSIAERIFSSNPTQISIGPKSNIGGFNKIDF